MVVILSQLFFSNNEAITNPFNSLTSSKIFLEVSIFDFVDQSGLKRIDPMIVNFIEALRSDIEKLNITDLDLDLDFKSDNIMIWNGNMVMVDW